MCSLSRITVFLCSLTLSVCPTHAGAFSWIFAEFLSVEASSTLALLVYDHFAVLEMILIQVCCNCLFLLLFFWFVFFFSSLLNL